MTLSRILIPVLALLTVSMSALTPDTTAHAANDQSAAGSIRVRVGARRAKRLQTIQQKERRQERHTEQNTVEAPMKDSDVLSRLKRREARRAKRLVGRMVSLKQQVLDATNAERAQMHLPPLTYNILLERSAQAYAEDMLHNAYFGHVDRDGQRVGNRIRKTGYGNIDIHTCRCSYNIIFGENLAKGQTSVAHVIASWMESKSHREAILSPTYKEMGVGIIDTIWVQHFGGITIDPVGRSPEH